MKKSAPASWREQGAESNEKIGKRRTVGTNFPFNMAINNGYYYLYPNVGGTFNSVNEVHDHKAHPISFRFSIRSKLRSIIKNINVVVDGMADTDGYIDEFVDLEENSVNGLFMLGNMFAVHGHKIKIAGDHPDNGVYFVKSDDPTKTVKIARIAENTASKVTGIIPDDTFAHNLIQIRTQFSAGSSNLKEPRTITSIFAVDQG